MHIFYNCYALVFGHFALCSRPKFRLGNAAFEKQLIGVHELYDPLSPALKLLLSNYSCKNKKNYFIHITRNNAYKVKMSYIQNIQGSLIYFTFLCPP